MYFFGNGITKYGLYGTSYFLNFEYMELAKYGLYGTSCFLNFEYIQY